MGFGVRLEAVRRAESLVAIVDDAGKGTLARVRPDVRFEVMGRGECLAALVLLAFIRPFLRMNSRMLLEVTQRCEKLGTNLTIERLPIMQTFMGSQPIPGVERLPAGTISTNKRLDFGMDPNVDLLTV